MADRAAARRLGELVTRRHQLVEMITAEKNRLVAVKGLIRKVKQALSNLARNQLS